MNWKLLLNLIPTKYLVKKLPLILGFILTKVLKWTIVNHPEKTERVKETAGEIVATMAILIKATDDGVITSDEIEAVWAQGKSVFD